MRNAPVNWSEGMFLRPHHFQAADRYLAELVNTQVLFDHPYGYGVHGLNISTEALAAGILEIRGLRVRWKDGTIIAQGDSQLDRIELNQRVDMRALGNAPLTVYLALAGMHEGRANVSAGGPHPHHRYAAVQVDADEEVHGSNRQEVCLRRLNVNFLFSTDDLSGYETFPSCAW